jgi:hypothetical protein
MTWEIVALVLYGAGLLGWLVSEAWRSYVALRALEATVQRIERLQRECA